MAEKAVDHQGPKANFLDVLGPELIVEIFSYLKVSDLGRVALVCKQFKELAYSRRFWKNVTFVYGLRIIKVSEDVVQSLMQKGIRRLQLCPRKLDTSDTLQPFQQMLPDVDYLTLLMNSNVPDPLGRFHAIIKQMDFSGVRDLDLAYTSEGCDEEGEIRLEEFLQKFPNLQSFKLNLYTLSEISNACLDDRLMQALKKVFEKLKNLTTLCVYIDTVNGRAPFPIVQLHQSDILEHLTLKRMLFDRDTLRAVGQCFPNLRKLQFVDSTYEDVEIGKHFCKYLGHLRELEFSICSNVDEKEFSGIRGFKCISSCNERAELTIKLSRLNSEL